MQKNSHDLFEFDRNAKGLIRVEERLCHCEEKRSFDATIHRKELGLIHNDVMVIGTDEAGRGPGAGGVFASAVYFPNPNDELIEKLACLNDSKKLSKKKREELYDIIMANTINSTVCIEVEEIEKINILNASLKAMKLACSNVILNDLFQQSRLGWQAQQHEADVLILVDGNKLIKDFYPSPELLKLVPHFEVLPSPSRGEGKSFQPFNFSAFPQKCIIKGDSKSASIAAASILAKVSRDRYMQDLDEKFPQYNWKQNAGYLTKEHLAAIEKYGITQIHRKSFLKGRNIKQLRLII